MLLRGLMDLRLRTDLPLRTEVVVRSGKYGFKIPKALIDIGYLKINKAYKVWIEEIDEK